MKGDFRKALYTLIKDLTEGTKSYTAILSDWDQNRGCDWVLNTKKDIIELGKELEEK